MKIVSKYVVCFFALIIYYPGFLLAQFSPNNLPLSVLEIIKTFQTNPTSENLLEVRKIGFSLLSEGKFAEAEIVFNQILAKSPNDGFSLYGKAVSLFNTKQLVAAEIEVAKANSIFAQQKNSASLADGLVLSAVISAVAGDNAAAIEKLKQAIVLVPTHFDANFSLGRAYFGSGDLINAIAVFRVALSQQPQNIKANFFLATSLERNGETTAALNAYRELIKIAPNVAEGYLGLGVLLVKTEGATSSEGVKSLQKAVAINPNLYEAQVTLGKVFLQQSKPDKALIHLQKAVKLLPDNPEPHYQLLQVFRRLGNKSEAEAELSIIKKIHEKHRGSSSKPR